MPGRYKDPDYQRKYHSRRWREDSEYKAKAQSNLREWRDNNRELNRGYDRKYYAKNGEEKRAKHREWIAKTIEAIRAPLLKRQNGKCAICGSPTPNRIDHDYDNGFVRGLLCHRCNVGLPYVEDDVYRERASAYISYWRENPSGIRNPLLGRKAKRKRRMLTHEE